MATSSSKFKVGDLVQLKAGGPVMVVEHTFSDSCKCQWFSGKKLEYGNFDYQTLVAATVEEKK